MRVFVRGAAVILISLLGFISFVPSQAQEGTPAATCDVNYGADAAVVFKNTSDTMNTGNATLTNIAAVYINLAGLRAQYEDRLAPTGCEPARLSILQITRLDADILFVFIAAKVDTKNAPGYTDFSSKVWSPRWNAFQATLGTDGISSKYASAAAIRTGSCSDTGFQSQVTKDLKMINGGSSSVDAPTIGARGLAVIQLRYKYEDAAPPAGCEMAQQDFIKLMGIAEDANTALLMQLGDTANAAAYTDFQNTLTQRSTPLYQIVTAELGNGVATPAATAAQ